MDKKLTVRSAAALNSKGNYHDGGGLYLQVTLRSDGSPRKSWLYRFVSPETKRERYMGLGSLEDVTLAKAREARDAARAVLKGGADPIEERERGQAQARIDAAQAIAKAMTFDQCAAAYIASHNAAWKNPKHQQQWKNTLATYASPVFGSLPVAAIDKSLVVKALQRDGFWTTKPETAQRVRGRIESVLDWATESEFREGENPARWKGKLSILLPARNKVQAVKHLEAMPYADVPRFMSTLAQRPETAASALRFVILTAARAGEAMGAKWDEIDFEARLWTVPASRMKAGKQHQVPLCDAAMAELEKMRAIRISDYIFPNGRGGRLSHTAFWKLLRSMNVAATTHGFRSSFRDWAGEETPFAREVCEAALAHAIENRVEAAYRRGTALEKRRALMKAWGEFLSGRAATL
jgi:integrase